MSRSATLIASPMPREPPVTIATRAMKSSCRLRLWRLGLRQPACKLAHDQLLQHGHAFRRIVEALEQRELLSTAIDEGLAPADPELLDCLDAVGGKSGSGDSYPLHASPRVV